MSAVMMDLRQAHALLPGSALVGDPDTALARVHTDTRSLQAGDLFVALKGERFDAHHFLPQAREAGAAAAIAERGLAEAQLPGLQVADTRTALAELSAAWRARMHLPLIAVTGSNGKTTVTQMIASVLRAWLGEAALATEGNFNNDIGVPLTLLRLRQDHAAGGAWHRAAVVELGMNHPGEIAQLARLAAPTVALVNNAQREHQEFMDGVEAVARENGAAIEALGPTGTAVFPSDDAHAPLWQKLAGTRPTLTFSLESSNAVHSDLMAEAVWSRDHWAVVLHTPAGATAIRLHVAGWHNVKNALAAAACALAAGCPLDAVGRGLEAFVPVKGRSQIRTLRRQGRELTLIDDSYNANPDSVRAAIDVLATLPGPRWLVLGDMGEVGDQGAAFHAEIGAYAKARHIESLWTAGSASVAAARAFGNPARAFDSVASLVGMLREAPAAASVVVKGSRFMKMEQVVAALQATADLH
ncbi:UDP-N-acetylmuramoyl-tripeptide--D-alanyl-D-alanine ligase [uncultured Methylibium sp.]|uniref:UDP-N-acetylmuramoyl-tripeptide--D-alanyl-D- alanine ligase n=1 Tax=uncultured Methylibium sp. TaxID=381093 RepID=UPI0025DE3FFF|nr:UDP-N-acetylmuramoyl-tripeptide--D-alanyl-D-alanine ligase [uncultured Methylibium sp.]